MSGLITSINNFFYNPIVDTNENIFQAIYTYGAKEEQIDKKFFIFSLFQKVILFPLKNFIYINDSHATDSFQKEYLFKSGGEPVAMQTPDGDILDGMYIPSRVGTGSQTFIQDILVQMYVADINRDDQALVEHLIKDISREDFENYILDTRNITNESFHRSFIDNLSISQVDIEDYLLDKANISRKDLDTYFQRETLYCADNKETYEKLTLRKNFYKRRLGYREGGKVVDCIPSQEVSGILEKIKGTSLIWDDAGYIGDFSYDSKTGAREDILGMGFTLTLAKKTQEFELPISFNRINYDTYLQPNNGVTGYSNKRTVLLATPTNYPYYLTLADYYSKRGLNVMMIDFRGRGESKGSSDSHKTKLDMETAYQYLREVHGIRNQDLIIHGHCMGAGPALDLASRRKGTHVVIDRSFATYQNVANSANIQERITNILQRSNFFTRISHYAEELLPTRVFAIATSISSGILSVIGHIASHIISTINYNNGENIRKVEGNIAVVMATQDPVTPEEETVQLINSLSDTKKNQVVKLLHTSQVGHTGAWWYRDKVTSLQLDQFLSQSHLL